MAAKYTKDPNATLDYTWDWASYLEEGETLTDSQIIVPSGIILESDSHSDTAAVAWLSGGTVNQVYRVVNRITTSEGRIDDRSIEIRVMER